MANEVRPQSSAEEPSVVLPGTQQPRRTSSFVREVVETLVLTAIVFFLVKAVAQPFTVDGPSMQPGLYTGDYVLASPLAYAFGAAPQRGDVVVLQPPIPGEHTDFIKRVIGLPGDTVTITPQAVFVDGKKLNEPYLYSQGTNLVPECGQVLNNITVAPNTYLVLGDNRGDSEDSRCFGSVPRQNIVGKAILVIFPFNQLHFINTYSNTFAGVTQNHK